MRDLHDMTLGNCSNAKQSVEDVILHLIPQAGAPHVLTRGGTTTSARDERLGEASLTMAPAKRDSFGPPKRSTVLY